MDVAVLQGCLGAALVAGVGTGHGFWRTRHDLAAVRSSLDAAVRRADVLEKRYAPVIDLDAAIKAREDERSRINTAAGELRASYAEKRKIFDALTHEVLALQNKLAAYGQDCWCWRLPVPCLRSWSRVCSNWAPTATV